ncbi:phosphotransferase family protein [Nocardia gipuzkoensis]|uniref:phosphotransferase family protein n=1 Tax=Nocardia gipuzkoensis TaxID=2749991 RepID=UPI002D80C21C|nr:phosphotransferase family protein [Nocardia gipuzkoensis]
MTETSPSPGDDVGVDLDALRQYLGSELAEIDTSALRVELIAGGRSNLTYRLTDGTRRWVLRRPPLGHVLATAHDMAREYRVMSALAPTAVPVPDVVLLCDDPHLIGAPFYLMREVAGTVYRTRADTAHLGPARARRISFALVDALAELHTIGPHAVGLEGLGHPEGYLCRQLQRWSKQLAASRSRDLPDLGRLRDRLMRAVPPDRAGAVVHGDFRLDNTIVAEDDSLAAIVDWELSTIGDPLADLGLFAAYWDGLAEMPGNPLSGGVSADAGFAPSAELLRRYGSQTGADLSDLSWYLAFGFFKVAAILEGIHFRYRQGKTVGSGFERIGALVEPIAAHGLSALSD